MVGGPAKDTQAACPSDRARFETETLSTTENLKHLMDLSGQWIDQAHQHRKLTKLILVVWPTPLCGVPHLIGAACDVPSRGDAT